jgi:hypothetical protein
MKKWDVHVSIIEPTGFYTGTVCLSSYWKKKYILDFLYRDVTLRETVVAVIVQ